MCMYVEVRVYISVYVSRCNNVYVFLCLSMSIYPHVCIPISVYIYTVFKVIIKGTAAARSTVTHV